LRTSDLEECMVKKFFPFLFLEKERRGGGKEGRE